MIVYHEIDPSSCGAVLKDGLKRTSRGEKGDDELIKTTDELLDSRRPSGLSQAGVSRDNNLYAYLSSDDHIIDIKDGLEKPISEFADRGEQVLLSLQVDSDKVYVSDLDRYDRLKEAVASGLGQPVLEELADTYWRAVISLKLYQPHSLRRPEAMITYDINSQLVEVVS